MAEDLREMQAFCRDVIRFSFYSFHMGSDFRSESTLFNPSIGRAVVGLQVYLRDDLRVAFLTSIGYITDSLPRLHALVNIKLLLNWHYFRGDVFNFMLANLATLVEMIIFLNEIGLDFPSQWFSKLWSHIYWYRIKDELIKAGGWPELIERAKTRYELSGIYNEICELFSASNFNPNVSVGIHSNQIFRIYDGFDPRLALFRNRPRTMATILSISMMDVIYHEEKVRDPNIYERLYAEIMDSENIQDLLTHPRPFERIV